MYSNSTQIEHLFTIKIYTRSIILLITSSYANESQWWASRLQITIREVSMNIKMSANKLILSILFSAAYIFGLPSVSLAQSSPGGSGGGESVYCKGSQPVVLDYFEANLPSNNSSENSLDWIKNKTFEEVDEYFIRSLYGYERLADALRKVQKKMGKFENWPQADVSNNHPNDAKLGYRLPKGCIRKLAAFRQDGIVYLDINVIKDLSPAQQAILKWHEILYEFSSKNYSNSVRYVIRSLLNKNFDQLPSLLSALNAHWYVEPKEKIIQLILNPTNENGEYYSSANDANLLCKKFGYEGFASGTYGDGRITALNCYFHR